MSGGRFEYKQYILSDLADELNDFKRRVDLKPIDSWNCESYKNYVKDIKKFKKKINKAINLLNEARIYIDRIDWFLSGDDGEDSFYLRLQNELNEYKKNKLKD